MSHLAGLFVCMQNTSLDKALLHSSASRGKMSVGRSKKGKQFVGERTVKKNGDFRLYCLLGGGGGS